MPRWQTHCSKKKKKRSGAHYILLCALQQMLCSSKILDCSKTQNPSWTLKLSLILGHRLSRAICTHDHGEPSEQRFSSVIIIAQNPSTQNVFVCARNKYPEIFFWQLALPLCVCSLPTVICFWVFSPRGFFSFGNGECFCFWRFFSLLQRWGHTATAGAAAAVVWAF